MGLGLGLALSLGASLINLFVAIAVRRASGRCRSIALEGGSHHLMTDVWTSVGVIAILVIVSITGLLWLDAPIAILVGLNTLFEGWSLVRGAAVG